MKIAIGADHKGFAQKELIKKSLNTSIDWIDVGTFDTQRTDYPIFAQKVAQLIQKKEVHAGVLLCATGIGMAIAANRFSNIYAGLVWNKEIAMLAKEDDNVNVLVIPSSFVSDDQLIPIITSWLDAQFKGERYQQRLDIINKWGGL